MNAADERERLAAAYARTRYTVLLPRGELILRLGAADAAADRRLRAEAGVQACWAIVTPCNPRSEIAPEQANAAALRALEEAVERAAQAHVPAVNRDPDRRWPDEPGLLLCDPPAGLAEALGRRFGQHAIVAGKLGGQAELLWVTR